MPKNKMLARLWLPLALVGVMLQASCGDATTGRVALQMTSPDAPVASDASLTTAEDTSAVVTLAATSPVAKPLTYSVLTQPAHGTLSGTAPALTYTPAANFNGADSFTFKANDGIYNSNTATVSLTVSAVNDAPVPTNQTLSTLMNTALGITLRGTDAESQALSFAVQTQPAHGTLTGTAPALTYTPATNYIGADSFTFTANDGALSSTVGTISISVASPDTTPPSVVSIGPSTALPFATTPIAVTFSEAMDPNSVSLGGALLSTYGAAVSWASGNTVLNIAPAYYWPQGTQALSINGADTSGNALTTYTVNFTVPAVQWLPKFGYFSNANLGVGNVTPFSIDPITGAGSVLGTYANGSSDARGIAVDPMGKFVFTANLAGTSVSSFVVNQSTGALTLAGSPVSNLYSPDTVVVHPTKNIIYVNSTTAGYIHVYSFDTTTGALTLMALYSASGSLLTNISSMAIDSTGRFLYAAGVYNIVIPQGKIVTIPIDGTTGALGTPTATAMGSTNLYLAAHPSANYLFAADQGASTLYPFTIDPTTGGLTAGTSVTTNTGSVYAAIHPDGSKVYVLDAAAQLRAYSFSTVGPSLSFLWAGSTLITPHTMAVDPSGRFMFVANSNGSDGLSGYLIGSAGISGLFGYPMLAGGIWGSAVSRKPQ